MTTLKKQMDLTGRRALITGAGGGLGRVMAECLAELGADLVLVDKSRVKLGNFVQTLQEHYGVSVAAIECDLEDAAERIDLSTRVLDGGGLNVLVNNAAFVGTSGLEGWNEPFEGQSIDTWRRAIEVNLTSCFHLAQLFASALGAGQGGNIINIASIYGQWGPDWSLYEDMGMSNPAAYATSKGGLLQLTRWLSTTMAPDVRVNAISPGGIARGQADEFVQRYEARTPLGRMATENDFRGAVAYLASDLSAYVTGTVLPVDGGWGAW